MLADYLSRYLENPSNAKEAEEDGDIYAIKATSHENFPTRTTRGEELKAAILKGAGHSKLNAQNTACPSGVVTEASKTTGRQRTKLSRSNLEGAETKRKAAAFGEIFKISSAESLNKFRREINYEELKEAQEEDEGPKKIYYR